MNWRPAITEIGISPRWPCIQKAVVANVRIMKPKRQPHDEGYIVSEPEMSVSFILCGPWISWQSGQTLSWAMVLVWGKNGYGCWDLSQFQKEANINVWFKINDHTRWHQMLMIHCLLVIFPVQEKKTFLLPPVVYSQTKMTAPFIFPRAGWRLTKTNNILAWSSLWLLVELLPQSNSVSTDISEEFFGVVFQICIRFRN